MARTTTTLQILVAYPDDVADERAILDDIVEELNNTWSRTLELRLDVIDWKTFVAPNFGSDPQAVINEQIGDVYDIFIGLMWMRFGEPTPRAGSGTAEEFERALERFRKDPNQLRIMFYFKDAAPTSLKEIDTAQLTLIREFRTRLGKEGGLYAEFSSADQFAAAVRLHLSKWAQEYGSTWGNLTTTIASTPDPPPTSTTSHDDEGFLDLVERGTEALETVTNLIGEINTTSQAFRSKLEERTNEMNALNAANASIKERKRALNRMAQAMDEYSSDIENTIPPMSNAYSSAMDAMTRAISIWREDSFGGREQAAGAVENVEKMIEVWNENVPTINFVRDTINAWPRVTSDFNRSKHRLTSALDEYRDEIQHEIVLATELRNHFKSLLDDQETTATNGN